jgi:multicomponent Na+:H+ antiporter subunit D
VDVLVPLALGLPLVAAAALTAAGPFMPRRADDICAILIAAAVTVMCAALTLRTEDAPIVYWFGDWQPREGGVAVGIGFEVEPLGAGIATLAALLMTASFVFSWRYFDEVGTLFHVLMLVFLGGMVGFAFTADLFTLFVFFELMSVSAFALCGYRIERPSVLQGALNFAITNTIGAFMILGGIGLLYGRTGALNLAQIGEALAAGPADGLVLVAFTLLAVGLLVKAAAVPFHFWMSDAYAVAPTPVAVLFAGVMSDLGIFALARVYWTVFAGPLAEDAGDVRSLLLDVGLLTALVGGAMCVLEAELKRLLAFVTIGHGGILLVGVALLTSRGLAGSMLYVLADGLVKGALFLAVGLVLNRLGHADELRVFGKGRPLHRAATLFGVCALGLAAAPPFGTFFAKSLIDESASALGLGWVPPLMTLATILMAGAVLRSAARIFLGLGDPRDPLLTREPRDEQEEAPEAATRGSPWVLVAPAALLAASALGLALVPDLSARAEQAASRLQDRPAQVAQILRGEEPPPVPLESQTPSKASWLYGAASAVGAVLVASLGLYRRRLPGIVRRTAAPIALPAVRGLKTVHSGVVGDYVTWLTLGTAAFGGVLALLVR